MQQHNLPGRGEVALALDTASPEPPAYYADQFNLQLTPYGANLVFLATMPVQGKVRPQAVVRMSHEHLKVIAILTRKQLKEFERTELGGREIIIAEGVLKQTRLENEPW